MNDSALGSPAMLAARPNRWPLWVPHAFVVAAIVTLVIGLASFAFWQERLRYRERATVATQNIARLLDQNVSDVFDKVDLVLRAIAFDYHDRAAQGRLDWTKINALLADKDLLIPEVLSFRIVDQNGIVRFGNGLPPAAAIDLSDRDYFIRARDDPTADLIISGPIFGRISQQWALILARRLNSPDGSFAGVVYANIPTASFERFSSALALGSHGAATIRTTDLALVHRTPHLKSAVGSKEVSQQLRAIVLAQSQAGEYIASTALDGIERSNAYRKLKRYPFYVIVGLATDDYLGGWGNNVLMLSGLAGLAILATCLTGILTYRSARRLAASMDVLRVTEGGLRDALHDSEALYNESPVGHHSLGPDGMVLRINDTELKWLGYPRDEIVGVRKFPELLTPASQETFRANYPVFMVSGLLHDLRIDMVRKNGTRLPVLVNATAIRDDDGCFVMSDSTLHDLTDKLRIETQLEEAQRIAHLGSWEVDLPSQRLVCSPEMFRIYGVPPQSAPTRETFLVTLHPDDRSASNQAFAAAVKNRNPLDITYRVLAADGGLKYVHVRGESCYAEDDTPLRVKGTAQDVTSIMLQEESLRFSEAFSRTILNSSPEHIAVLDAQGVVVSVNDTWKRFSEENGTPRLAAASVGMDYRHTCTAAAGQTTETSSAWTGIEAVLNRRLEHFTFDYPCDSPNECCWFRMRVYPMIAPCTGAVVTHENISERKRAEADLERHRRHLESLATEQAAHLRDLAKELTRTEQRERDDLYELLHDDVQPLLVATRLLLSSLGPRTAQEDCLRCAADSCAHISRVLQVTRTLSHQLSPPLIRERGLQPALESLRHWVKVNHRLQVDLIGTQVVEPEEMAIRLLCFNAVRELLMNVVKHAGTNRAEVRLQLVNDDNFCITVDDDGCGFDPACISSGSGLAGIDRRLSMFGGSLQIDSQPGHGTVATLLAPLRPVVADVTGKLAWASH